MANKEIKLFKSGVHSLLDNEIIPVDSASDSSNWYTSDGRIKLINGKEIVGDAGIVGNVTGQIFGYKVDGTKIHWRKIGTKIQYLNGSTWTDTITGLTSSADYSFANYSSLAGSFTFAGGADGIFKMNNASPQSYSTMYDSIKNYKGKIMIDKGRMKLWGRIENKTMLYTSCFDNQLVISGSVGVYTAVTGENTASLTGTLAFKAGGATRNCFKVAITLTGTGEVYTDSYLGTLAGSLGGTGTINYITGAYTVSNAGVGTASYFWENSNLRGLTDFVTLASPRTATDSFETPQNEGGDEILNVVIGGSNGYFSLKSQSAYLSTISDDGLTLTNDVYRKELGIQSWRGLISTNLGIIFMNLAKPEKPEMTILEKSLVTNDLIPKVLFPQFKFANYDYSDCLIDIYEKYTLIACKTLGAINNDIILLCDHTNNTVDITKYSARTFARNAGDLYIGSSISQNIYKLFNGFDDDGNIIDNYWIGKAETWDTNKLKKYRFLRTKGNIAPEQSYEVYINYDGAGFQLVGTVLGMGSYVDYSSPQSIGTNMIGEAQIGGDDVANIYPYFMEIKLRKVPKFRNRQIMFVAKGVGYVDIDSQMDLFIDTYEEKLPNRFRLKQNVSFNGIIVNQDNP